MKFSDTLLVFGTDICNFSDKYLEVKESDSNISLKVFTNLAKEENFEDKLDDFSKQSSISENIVEEMIEKSIDDMKDNNDLTLIKNVIKDSDDFLTKKIIKISEKKK